MHTAESVYHLARRMNNLSELTLLINGLERWCLCQWIHCCWYCGDFLSIGYEVHFFLWNRTILQSSNVNWFLFPTVPLAPVTDILASPKPLGRGEYSKHCGINSEVGVIFVNLRFRILCVVWNPGLAEKCHAWRVDQRSTSHSVISFLDHSHTISLNNGAFLPWKTIQISILADSCVMWLICIMDGGIAILWTILRREPFC